MVERAALSVARGKAPCPTSTIRYRTECTLIGNEVDKARGEAQRRLVTAARGSLRGKRCHHLCGERAAQHEVVDKLRAAVPSAPGQSEIRARKARGAFGSDCL